MTALEDPVGTIEAAFENLDVQPECSYPLYQPVVIPIEAYVSHDYAAAENDRLWGKVWQVACRVEEIPDVGDYVTYDIVDESIIVVRSAPDTIEAFYNVCQHRGATAGRRGMWQCPAIPLRFSRLALETRWPEHVRQRPSGMGRTSSRPRTPGCRR